MCCRRWAGRSRCYQGHPGPGPSGSPIRARDARLLPRIRLLRIYAGSFMKELCGPNIRVWNVRLRQGFGEMSEFGIRRRTSRHSRLPATADKPHRKSRFFNIHVFSTGYRVVPGQPWRRRTTSRARGVMSSPTSPPPEGEEFPFRSPPSSPAVTRASQQAAKVEREQDEAEESQSSRRSVRGRATACTILFSTGGWWWRKGGRSWGLRGPVVRRPSFCGRAFTLLRWARCGCRGSFLPPLEPDSCVVVALPASIGPFQPTWPNHLEVVAVDEAETPARFGTVFEKRTVAERELSPVTRRPASLEPSNIPAAAQARPLESAADLVVFGGAERDLDEDRRIVAARAAAPKLAVLLGRQRRRPIRPRQAHDAEDRSSK